MKRTACILIALLILLPLMCVSSYAASDASASIDGFNTYRGENQLVIYNTAGSRTATNEWGYEVTVGSDGRISSVGSNNSLVPQNGFVISGHGTAASFLRENASVGRYARCFEENLTVVISDSPVLPFYSFTLSFAGINITRTTDSLVIYCEKTKTGTNEWGCEAIVDADGRITEIGGNNSAIPSGGFVISGHGEMSDEIKSRLSVGMFASYDASTLVLTISYTIDSLIYADSLRLESARSMLDEDTASFAVIDFDAAESLMSRLEDEYASAVESYASSSDAQAYGEYSLSLSDSLGTLLSLLSESNPSEYRAVWVRPTQTSRASVASFVRNLYNLGANAIYIETQYDCTTIYPTPKDSLFVQNPRFGGFDVLEAYIEECHSLGMELHLWLPIYYVGNTNSGNAGVSVFAKRPDMFVKSQNNSIYASSGDTWMFLDPSNEDATVFLLGTISYLLESYDIDCIQLDYIRYQGAGTDDWGYFSAAAEQFEAKHGFAPTYNKSAYWWSDWSAIRASFVTDFVRRVRELIDEKNGSVLLSADVFPYTASAKLSIYQDCRVWVEKGYLDILHPMTYGRGAPEERLPEFVSMCADSCALVPGIGLYLAELSSLTYYSQLRYCAFTGCMGSAAFEGNAFSAKSGVSFISGGSFGERAYSPKYRNTDALCAYVRLMKSRSALMCEKGALTTSENELLSSSLGKAEAYYRAEGSRSSAPDMISQAIETVTDPAARAILEKDLAYLKILASLGKDGFGCRIDAENGYVFLRENTDISALEEMFADMKSFSSQFTGRISTGDAAELDAGDGKKEFVFIVSGDVNRDGLVNTVDYLMLKRAFLGTYTLSGAAYTAGCLTDGKKIGTNDYIKLKRFVLGTFDIYA